MSLRPAGIIRKRNAGADNHGMSGVGWSDEGACFKPQRSPKTAIPPSLRMPDFASFSIAWAATAVVFVLPDYIWLSNMTAVLYRPRIGAHLAAEPGLVIAAVFYIFHAAGAAHFAVSPGLAAGSHLVTLVNGAALGALAYGTDNATNLATLKDWSSLVAIVDTGWGALLTATASCAGLAGTRLFQGAA